MTPVDLVSGAMDETDQTVTNMARLLQTLDDDDNLLNGITIPNTILNVIGNRNIVFSVSSEDFAGNSDLQAVLTALGKILIDESEARDHLGSSLDIYYPEVKDCEIVGPPNTHFVLSGDYGYNDSDGGEEEGSSYQWFRADDSSGENGTAIEGATGLTYHPQPADLGKHLIFKVTPASVGGDYTGSQCTTAAKGPVTEDTTVTVYGSIDSASKVDQYTIRLSTSSNVSINVLSYEGGYSAHGRTSGLSLLEGDLTNGESNDYLLSNVFLFNSDSTLIDFRDGDTLCTRCSSCHGYGYKAEDTPGYPGCEAPGAFYTRSPRNPLMEVLGLDAGDYILAIGAQYLNSSDAWAGTNAGDDNWGYANPDFYFNNYKITFIFY
jgi:hypothetical protein